MKTFYFLAGLPRSGSTVLASILNQNPEVYVTPTSPMLDLLVKNQDTFWELPPVKANPCPDQLTNVTRAMIRIEVGVKIYQHLKLYLKKISK